MVSTMNYLDVPKNLSIPCETDILKFSVQIIVKGLKLFPMIGILILGLLTKNFIM